MPDKMMLVLFLFYVGCLRGMNFARLKDIVFVSRVRGHEGTICGSKALPCKTLQDGIDKLSWHGQLYVDGESTSLDPYKCQSSEGKVMAMKSFSLLSYTTTAHISCVNGFTVSNDGTRTGIDVTITGVQFKNTVLYLRNVNATIQRCTFLESSPAIDVKNSIGLLLYSLDIKESLFERNHGCIDFVEVDHQGEYKRSSSRILLKVDNVIFRENTAFEDVAKGGLVFVKHTSCFSNNVSFLSLWNNVTTLRNTKASIYDHETREKVQNYPNVTISDTRPNSILDSLFVVYTCSANISLEQITSDYNIGMRYLGIKCCHSYVRISKSGFHRHSVRGPGGVVYISDGELIDIAINDSKFTRNNASIGGVLQIDGGNKKSVILGIFNVNFQYCSGNIIGCTISIGDITKLGVSKAFVALNNVLFDQCHSRIKRKGTSKMLNGPLCLRAAQKTDVIICDTTFFKNKNRASVVIILHIPPTNKNSSFSAKILRTKFDRNKADPKKPLLMIQVQNSNMVQSSKLTISDSIFRYNKGIAIKVDNIRNIKFINLTCNYTRGNCYDFYIGKQKGHKRTAPSSFNVSFLIQNSTFAKNYKSFDVKYVEPAFTDVQVRDVVVLENTKGNPVLLQFGSTKVKNLTINGNALFHRFYFISNIRYETAKYYPMFSVAVPDFHNGNISVVFRQSEFKNNFHSIPTKDKSLPKSLLFFKLPEDELQSNNTGFPSYKYRNTFRFEEVIFENNTGSSFIAYIANGKTSFTRCLFKNNYAHKHDTGAHLFIQEGTSSVEFLQTTFVQTKSKPIYSIPGIYSKDYELPIMFVFAAGRGPLILRNSIFVHSNSSERVIPHFTIQTEGYVYIDNDTKLLCPVGSYMYLEDGSHIIHQGSKGSLINITQLKFICKQCGVGEYSLERGSYHGTLRQITCLEFCPFGADCTWNIKSRPDFWGYHTRKDPPQLNFTRCPENYCRVPRSKTNGSVYNECYGNRTGLMCGACKEGFTESMFNSKCCLISKCRDGWFWLIAGLYSVIMAWYLLCRPPVVLCLLNNLLWFKRAKNVLPRNLGEPPKTTDENGRHGYSKIIFYFYQVSSLLMLESSSEILKKHAFISFVISIYNFKVEVADSKFGCPFPGLTAVTKLLFLSLQVFAVMAFLIVIYFLHLLLWSIRKRSTPSFAPYLAAIFEVLILGYVRLGQTSLNLLNCVPLNVNGQVEWRLVLDGNITCWVHWWQYAMIAYNVVFVIPFLLVLLLGTSKLRRQEISAWRFVLACFVPLLYLVYWMVKHCLTRHNNEIRTQNESTEDHDRRKALLKVLQGPFRPPDNQSRGAYYWESVLIGRRLILLCLYSFISTPMLRMLFMTTVCIVIFVHNVIITPYRDKKAHIFAVILLSMNVALAIINLCKSVLVTVGVTPTGPTEAQIYGLQLFEVALLGALPFIFVVFILVTLFSQLVRILVLIIQYLIQVCRPKDKIILDDINSREEDCYRPLLDPNGQESLSCSELQV